MSGVKWERKSSHQRTRYSLSPLATPAALLDVFKAADDSAVQRNPAGALLQLVRCTQAVGESPLKLGLAGGPGDAWFAAGGAAVCARGEDFPRVLFERWLAVLQQAGSRLPYKAENWDTVAAVIKEGRRQLAAAGLACGSAAEEAQQLATTHLAACLALEAAVGDASEAAAAAPQRSQQPGAAAAASQQQQQPDAAPLSASKRSQRRVAVSAQAAIVAAVEDDEEGLQADAAAGYWRHNGSPAGSGSPGDQENAGEAGQRLQRAGSAHLAAKRISGVAGAAGPVAQARQALQPAGGGEQQGGSHVAKRQRH